MTGRPDWLKVRIPSGENFFEVRRIVKSHKLNTVCEDARCPNLAECWGKRRTATFMILGDTCTRACAYCAVKSGQPTELDLLEPTRVAAAVGDMKLKHAVITSVDRDDLADGGANVFADTVREIRRLDADVKVELLTPDFGGSMDSLRTVLDAGPDIFSHNIEDRRTPLSHHAIQIGLYRFRLGCSRRQEKDRQASSPRRGSWWGLVKRPRRSTS